MTLVLQCLYCLEAGLQNYNDLTRALVSQNNVQEVAKVGMDLNTLLVDTNILFGDLIVSEYVFNIIASTLGLFTSLSFFNVSKE